MRKTKSPVRRGRPPADTTETRTRLLEAASRVFNVDGYFGTDTNKIAREAGLAPATFYRHFADKLAIFLEAYAYWVGKEWHVIEQASRIPGTEQQIAKAIVAAMLEHHHEWRGFRASMHALVAIEKKAKAFAEAERRRQIKRMIGNVPPSMNMRRTEADLAFSFLSIERANNAITDGDLDALGIDKQDFIERLEREILYLRTGRRRTASGR